MTDRARDRLVGLRSLPRARDLLSPWSVTNISVYPFGPGWWPFNPSIHVDPRDGTWRCLVRCANYTLPDGIPQLSSDARVGRAQTRNVLLTLGEDLAPRSLAELVEPAASRAPPRALCTSMGLEDLRLFCTRADGLVAVGCALQHNLDHPNRPEIVLCRIGDQPSLVRTRRGDAVVPILSVDLLRGDWGFRPQKNWVPFDATERVRLLYSIERGIVMAEDGPAPGSPPPLLARVPPPAYHQIRPPGRGNTEVRLSSRTIAMVSPPRVAKHVVDRHDELRGGSQLVALPDGRWLGVAHEMTFSRIGQSKFYWHTFYTVDNAGCLLERSPALRLSGDHGIEFAAGLAIDGAGRLAVSYGTDDHEAWIATTTLDAVLQILRPATARADGADGAYGDGADDDSDGGDGGDDSKANIGGVYRSDLSGER